MDMDDLQVWREPLQSGWLGEAADLATCLTSEPQTIDFKRLAGRLRRLAGVRLGDIEKLRLRRLSKVARIFSFKLPGYRVFRLLLVSNRTVSFFAGELETSGLARGLLIEAVETDFDSVANLALNPSANVPEGRFDAVLLLVDEDFFPDRGKLLDDEGEDAALATSLNRLNSITAGLKSRIGAPVIAATIAGRADVRTATSDVLTPGTTHRFVWRLNNGLIQLATKGEFYLFDLASIAKHVGLSRYHDPVRFFQAKTPFAIEAGPVIADALSAQIAAMAGRTGRVLVLDLDNTIWGGVIADDGLDHIVLGQGSPDGEAFLSIQRFALQLRERGIILAVCSKNLESIAREPFRLHPEMILKEEHITVFVANFEDKATNILRIAETLNLDPSVLVFLDDNAAERERVRSSLPNVMVPEIGSDPAQYVPTLIMSGYFEYLPLTQDDIGRANAYEARSQAKALEESVGDYDIYLQSLKMQLKVAHFDARNRTRVTQLINKSNQFNLTAQRYSEVEVANFENDPAVLTWHARLQDRFADHGIISVVIVHKCIESWRIDTWIMSCRVLERGVEVAMMAALAAAAYEVGAREIIGVYKPTDRNGLVANFYPQLGFDLVSCDDVGVKTFRLSLPLVSARQGAIDLEFTKRSLEL